MTLDIKALRHYWDFHAKPVADCPVCLEQFEAQLQTRLAPFFEGAVLDASGLVFTQVQSMVQAAIDEQFGRPEPSDLFDIDVAQVGRNICVSITPKD